MIHESNMSLVRFFNNQNLVCGLVFYGLDPGEDLLKWLCAHPCLIGIEHMACIYRLYARFKYQSSVCLIQDARISKSMIRLKYDLFLRNNEVLIKARDYATGIRVKGSPHQLSQYLYGKN